MPKQANVERFKISCLVDTAEQMGAVVAQLTRMDVQNVGFELVTELRTFNKNTSHEVKSEDLLKTWIEEHPTFKTKEAVKYFVEQGRTAGSAYQCLKRLSEQKIVRKLGAASYARAD